MDQKESLLINLNDMIQSIESIRGHQYASIASNLASLINAHNNAIAIACKCFEDSQSIEHNQFHLADSIVCLSFDTIIKSLDSFHPESGKFLGLEKDVKMILDRINTGK